MDITKRNKYKAQFLFRFSTFVFQYISSFRSQITYSFVKCGCSIYIFLNSANLIYRGTDISKHFKEFIGLRGNESRLYFKILHSLLRLPKMLLYNRMFNYFKHHVYYISINSFIYYVSKNNFLEQHVYNNMFMFLILD